MPCCRGVRGRPCHPVLPTPVSTGSGSKGRITGQLPCQPLSPLSGTPLRRSTIERNIRIVKLRVSSVRTILRECAVSVWAKPTPANDRIGDSRCVATTNVPRFRANAAPAIAAGAQGRFVPHCVSSTRISFCFCGECRQCGLQPQYRGTGSDIVCGWLLHCKSFLRDCCGRFCQYRRLSGLFVRWCSACLDEFRDRGSNRLVDLRRGPLTFPECPCSWLTYFRIITSTSCIS